MKLVKLPRKNSARARTLVEVFVIVVVIGLLVLLLSPSLRRAKERTQLITCNANLKGAGGTFRIREMDTRGKFPMQVFITHGGVVELIETNPCSVLQVMSNEFGNCEAKVLVCQADPRRSPPRNLTTDF